MIEIATKLSSDYSDFNATNSMSNILSKVEIHVICEEELIDEAIFGPLFTKEDFIFLSHVQGSEPIYTIEN